ncbi:sulfurtransferase complex subunit TusD [Endozoicomonadaceae bacterium StTr2]
MKYSLAVRAAPYSSQANQTALSFAQALIEAGHSIHRIFFYQDGVHSGSSLAVAGQDELALPQNWQQFCTDHSIDSVVCIAAALKRGVINSEEAARYQRSAANMADGHELSGLGQLIDAMVESDRFISFGS